MERGSYVKWTGGKASLLRRLAREGLLPERGWEAMADPFLGGGASLAFFRPRRALLEDVDPHLVAFYQRLRDADPAFTESLWGIGELWDHLFRYLSPAPLRWHQPPPEPLAGEGEALLDQVGASLEAGGKAPQETLVRRGVYWHLRRRAEELPLQDPRSSAYFWAVRELAFGSIYRQNRTGGFNVPYGGTSYDRKRLLPSSRAFWRKRAGPSCRRPRSSASTSRRPSGAPRLEPFSSSTLRT